MFPIVIYCKMKFIPVMRSCIFSIITPVFSVTWSSEIIIICWFTAQETFLIIINVENGMLLKYFVKIVIFKNSLMTKKFKRKAFIWIEFVQSVLYDKKQTFNIMSRHLNWDVPHQTLTFIAEIVKEIHFKGRKMTLREIVV